jgi:hypothetical protein
VRRNYLQVLAILGLGLSGMCASNGVAAVGVTQENFIINAQYRGAISQSFRGIGKGNVVYQGTPNGQFSLTISGAMKNPETKELYKMKVSGTFIMKGNKIERISQEIDMNNEAKRYETLVVHNLPFCYLARFRNLPKSADPDEISYKFDGRDYTLRYATVENAVEATIYETGIMIGKFFLHGDFGKPPRGLTKARMVGSNHVVFSLVIEHPAAGRGE